MTIKLTPNRRVAVLVATIVIGLAAAIYIVVSYGPGSHSKDTSAGQNQSQNQSQSQSTPKAAVTDPGTQSQPTAQTTITISANGFSPASITIGKGTTLTWKNADSTDHAVASQAGQPGPHSPKMAPGDSFSYNFQTPGTYTYTDAMNGSHTATVIVKDVD